MKCLLEEKVQKIQETQKEILRELKWLREFLSHLEEKEVSKKIDEEKYIESKSIEVDKDSDLFYQCFELGSIEFGKVIVDLMAIFENKPYQYKIEEYDVWCDAYRGRGDEFKIACDFVPDYTEKKFQIFLNNQTLSPLEKEIINVVSFPIRSFTPISFIKDYQDTDIYKTDLYMDIRPFLQRFHYIEAFIDMVVDYRYKITKKQQLDQPAPITSDELEQLKQYFLRDNHFQIVQRQLKK